MLGGFLLMMFLYLWLMLLLVAGWITQLTFQESLQVQSTQITVHSK